MVNLCFSVVVLMPLLSQDGFYRPKELLVGFRTAFFIHVVVMRPVIGLADPARGKDPPEPGLFHLAYGGKPVLQESVYEVAHPLLLAVKDPDGYKGSAQVEELAKIQFRSRLELSSVAMPVDGGTVVDIQVVAVIIQRERFQLFHACPPFCPVMVSMIERDIPCM